MIRYRLSKNKPLQAVFLVVYFSIVMLYIASFSVDLYRVVDTAYQNTRLIRSDKNIEIIDDYEMRGTSEVKIGNKVYKGTRIVFYGINAHGNKTYFNEKSNTIIQSLPKNFGVSFLISTNAFLVFVCAIGVSAMLTYQRDKLVLVNRWVCLFTWLLVGVLTLLMLFAFLVLY